MNTSIPHSNMLSSSNPARIVSAVEPAFDDLACKAIELCGVPVSVLCLGATRRIVFSADTNFTVADIPCAELLCNSVRDALEPIVVCDPERVTRFGPQRPLRNGRALRFFAGVPVLDGEGGVAGVMCVLDFAPREFTTAQQTTLQMLARDASTRLQLQQAVTERARLQTELDKLAATLEERVQERTAQLQAANMELEAFAYSVAHDLSAPLRAIEAMPMQVLETETLNLSPGAQHKLRMIEERARRMQQLIRHLLAFSRSSHKPVRRQSINPTKLVGALMEDFRDQHPGRTILFRLNALPVSDADPSLLRQVFINLISNAIKFTAPREVGVIEIGALPGEGQPVFYVRDNGIGFDPGYARRLFGAFEQLHDVRRFAGVGVGLSLVRRIVERHGGAVWAESEPGKGATFKFTLAPSSGQVNLSGDPVTEEVVPIQSENQARLPANVAS